MNSNSLNEELSTHVEDCGLLFERWEFYAFMVSEMEALLKHWQEHKGRKPVAR